VPKPPHERSAEERRDANRNCRCGWFLVDLEGRVTDERLPEATRLRSWKGNLFWSFLDPRYDISVRHLRLKRGGEELPVRTEVGEARWVRVFPSGTGRGFVIHVSLKPGCTATPPAGFAGYGVPGFDA
jgi:hypothetical protein